MIVKLEMTLGRGNPHLNVGSEPRCVHSKPISHSYEVLILSEEAELEGLLNNSYWVRQVSNLRPSARNCSSVLLHLQGFKLEWYGKQMHKGLNLKAYWYNKHKFLNKRFSVMSFISHRELLGCFVSYLTIRYLNYSCFVAFWQWSQIMSSEAYGTKQSQPIFR
jgi:hypothetical protein